MERGELIMIPLLFSCEHATCAVPEAWRDVFRGQEETVASHEGWEPGSLNLAQGFSMKFRTPLIHGDVTRLLIDLDFNGDERWSRFSKKLTDAQRGKLDERHQRPYRDALSNRVAEALKRESMIIHVMVHTSTSDEGRVVLETLAGDQNAKGIVDAWASSIRRGPEPLPLETRWITTLPAAAAGLLAVHGEKVYVPIVLRVSQTFFLEGRPWRWEKMKKHIIDSLNQAMTTITPAPKIDSYPGY